MSCHSMTPNAPARPNFFRLFLRPFLPTETTSTTGSKSPEADGRFLKSNCTIVHIRSVGLLKVTELNAHPKDRPSQVV